MEEKDLIEIKRLLTINVADMIDKNSAQELIQKYIELLECFLHE